jgi:3-hydroxyacyl-CoA dehydrogenase
MPRVAIIGSGLIGRAWAMVFARAGWDAALYDSVDGAAGNALGLVAEGLDDLAKHGLVADPKGSAARVARREKHRDALDGASYVQENVPETVDAKRAIFAELDALAAPDAILASSTSAIVASLFTESLKGRARCLVAHPVNPPHLVPIVELVGAPWTAPETIARAKQVYESINQVPIVVRREIEGFISIACRARCSPRRSAWSARVTSRRRISTRPSRTALACAGRSWGRSPRSS